MSAEKSTELFRGSPRIHNGSEIALEIIVANEHRLTLRGALLSAFVALGLFVGGVVSEKVR
jgi:hypothetical protein